MTRKDELFQELSRKEIELTAIRRQARILNAEIKEIRKELNLIFRADPKLSAPELANHVFTFIDLDDD